MVGIARAGIVASNGCGYFTCSAARAGCGKVLPAPRLSCILCAYAIDDK
ncbi:hypothetical protein BN2497_10751 [Janthinobacterium sp. CG23_2]|nr:hypothetical protein BN2497_10751 [Janthinobacterium sp. CG23_2]CUU31773.1 hypothetical protein BN3177_10751 [Janthinobacterium sp. CG23_2]